MAQREKLYQALWSYLEQRNYAQMIETAKAILAIKQDDAKAWEVLAGAYISIFDVPKAREAVKNLQKLCPDEFMTHFLEARTDFLDENYGEVLEKLQAVEQRWKYRMVDNQDALLCNLFGQTYKILGLHEESLRYYRQAIRRKDDQEDLAEDYSVYLFNLHYPDLPPQTLYEAHKKYGALFRGVQRYQHDRARLRARFEASGQIRVGYISPDIRDHVVIYFSYALLTRHTKAKFHVTCYARCKEDAVSEQIRGCVDCWRNVKGWSDAEIARAVRADGIDILVELAGHTRNNCLPVLAYKPAPVQLCGIGYFDTTGLEAVDYFLSDRYCDPEGQNDAYFVERLIRLPHSHFCYTAPDTMPPCREAPCLRRGSVTFGSFNNFSKLTDAMLRLWNEILRRLPEARLILKSKLFSSAYGRAYTQTRLEGLGFSMAQVEFRPETPVYLPEYHDVDIALDTYPYPGGGTTCDALYMGVPVVTLVGERHGARFGYSLLKNLALKDCIAFSPEEYVEKAVALAKDTARLNCLHLHLRARMQASPLMDRELYMREVETAYEEIWRAFLAQRDARFCWEDDISQISQAQRLKQLCADAAAAGNQQRVVEIYARAREMQVADGEFALAAARAYLALREYAQAFAAAQAARAQGADRTQALLLGAEAAAERLDIDSAIRLYQEILTGGAAKTDAGAAQERKAWLGLARLHHAVGDARACAQIYLSLLPTLQTEVEKCRAYSAFLLAMHYGADVREEWRLFLHRRFEQFFAQIPRYRHERAEEKQRKLRIGYLSPDFRQHAVAFFCYQLLAEHDQDRFEIFCYAIGGPFDQTTEQLRRFGHHWRDLREASAKEAAEAVYADRIDILFDLAGHTADNGLPVLAYKPAPVQISGIGYFDTTGLSAVDYVLTDRHVDPPGQNDACFTEKLLRLAHSHLCYTARADAPACAPAPVLRNGYVTFCSFNRGEKITDGVLRVWKEILAKVPDAKLLLKNAALQSAYGRERMQERFARVGLPAERIVLRPSDACYMQAYLEADIALDTFPYPGGATTCEALYMGVPVVALAGKRHGARFAYGILTNAGLAECIAFSETEYVEKAVALAQDTSRLRELHLGLRARLCASPLMNGKLYAREVEAAYLGVWREYLAAQAGETPQRDAAALTARCKAALQQKDYALALRTAEDLLAAEDVNGDARYFLARAYYELRAYDKAISQAQAALAQRTRYVAESYQAMGLARQAKLQYAQAADTFAQGLAVARESADGTDALVCALAQNLGQLRLNMGDWVAARELYLLASQAAEDLRARVENYSSYLLCLHCDPALSAQALSAAHKAYGAFFTPAARREPRRRSGAKIRIGYLSPDFRQHVMFYFYHQLLACYDKSQFEVVCYALGAEDAFTTHIKGLVNDWRDLRGMSYEEAAATIYADEIDILYDLAGHSAGSGLPILAYRPAPVQISGLGYMSTTGLPAVDCFVGDVFTDPTPQDDAYFTERLLRLSQSQFCYAGRNDVGRSQGAPCKKNGCVTFCSFNRYEKFTDEMLTMWKQILDRTPHSRLVLKCQVFASKEAEALARQRLTRLGFAPERVELRPATDTYMNEYLEMDIALDTYPYQGGGTTCDALYMGVPVVTLAGDRHSRRFGYSILKNAGLEELVVEGLQAYADKAVALAGDAELLDILHKNLRGMLLRSPLMDEKAYVGEMETLYKYLAENGMEAFDRQVSKNMI